MNVLRHHTDLAALAAVQTSVTHQTDREPRRPTTARKAAAEVRTGVSTLTSSPPRAASRAPSHRSSHADGMHNGAPPPWRVAPLRRSSALCSARHNTASRVSTRTLDVPPALAVSANGRLKRAGARLGTCSEGSDDVGEHSKRACDGWDVHECGGHAIEHMVRGAAIAPFARRRRRGGGWPTQKAAG